MRQLDKEIHISESKEGGGVTGSIYSQLGLLFIPLLGLNDAVLPFSVQNLLQLLLFSSEW